MRTAQPAEATEAKPAAAEPGRQELAKRDSAREPRGLSDSQVLALYQPGSYEIVPHDTMRRFIAERLTLSKQTIPHFYLAIDCELDALLAARARLNALAPQRGSACLQALGQRLHHQGDGDGAADRAGRQRHLDGAGHACAIAPRTSPWRWRSKAAGCTRR